MKFKSIIVSSISVLFIALVVFLIDIVEANDEFQNEKYDYFLKVRLESFEGFNSLIPLQYINEIYNHIFIRYGYEFNEDNYHGLRLPKTDASDYYIIVRDSPYGADTGIRLVNGAKLVINNSEILRDWIRIIHPFEGYIFIGSSPDSSYEIERINNFKQRQAKLVEMELSNRLFVFGDKLDMKAFNQMFEALPEEQRNFILEMYSSIEGTENPNYSSESFAKFLSKPIRESLLPIIDYFELDLNFESFEIDEDFYNYWSEGNIKTIRVDSTALSRSFEQFSANERLGRVRLAYGTTVRLISRDIAFVSSTFHEEATIAIVEFVEVLDGTYAGRLGFLDNYNLY